MCKTCILFKCIEYILCCLLKIIIDEQYYYKLINKTILFEYILYKQYKYLMFFKRVNKLIFISKILLGSIFPTTANQC